MVAAEAGEEAVMQGNNENNACGRYTWLLAQPLDLGPEHPQKARGVSQRHE